MAYRSGMSFCHVIFKPNFAIQIFEAIEFSKCCLHSKIEISERFEPFSCWGGGGQFDPPLNFFLQKVLVLGC